MQNTGKLYLLCGKMAAGKSTLAQTLAATHSAVVISEDNLLASLYPGEIHDLADYVKYSSRVRSAIEPVVVGMLRIGVSLVLDYPANTVKQREWMMSLIYKSAVQHELHWIDVSDSVCKSRLAERAVQQPERAATDTPEMFDALRPYFEPPANHEGFDVIVHD